MTRSTLLATLVALAACAADPADRDARDRVEIAGNLTQLNPSDPTSPWVGWETARVIGRSATLDCASEWDLDGVEAAEPQTCASCDVTLDVVRSVVRELAEDCDVVLDEASVSTTWRTLAFETLDRDLGLATGRVLVADDDGAWRTWAGGVFDGEAIAYHRTVYVGGGPSASGSGDFVPKHQEEPPTADH